MELDKDTFVSAPIVSERGDNFLQIGRLYPSDGIPGLLSTPETQPGFIESYRMALNAMPSTDITFMRIISVPAHASRWFIPGDVICRPDDLDSPFYDVLRSQLSLTYMGANTYTDVDEYMIEDARKSSIEHNHWSFRRDKYQLTICDPFGRAVSLRHDRGGPSKWFRGLRRTLPVADSDKMRNLHCDPWFLESGRFVFRFIHWACMRDDPKIEAKTILRLKVICRSLFEIFLERPNLPKDESWMRMGVMTGRSGLYPFWNRLHEMFNDDPWSLPRALRLVVEARIRGLEVGWVRCTVAEFEDALRLAILPEWDVFVPPIVSFGEARGQKEYGWRYSQRT